jgi:hypothetical protein
LEPEPLQALFSSQMVNDLRELKARISLGILDLSEERADVVRRLNKAGVPVIAWLLLPKEQGYWFNMGNPAQAKARYNEFKSWTDINDLHWSGIGLDIEPDIREMNQFAANKLRLLPKLFERLLNRKGFKNARSSYRRLVNKIHTDGYIIDAYQLPFVVDERLAGSTLLQRLIGLVDIPSDREVWMLYTSFLRPHGSGFLASYASQAQSVGLGITGGGVDVEIFDRRPLSWDEFARDLRLAWYWCDDIYIFSLEGCLRQSFIPRLKNFEWDYPMMLPDESTVQVEGWRRLLRSVLWISAHSTAILVAGLSILLLWKGINRYIRRNEVQLD